MSFRRSTAGEEIFPSVRDPRNFPPAIRLLLGSSWVLPGPAMGPPAAISDENTVGPCYGVSREFAKVAQPWALRRSQRFRARILITCGQRCHGTRSPQFSVRRSVRTWQRGQLDSDQFRHTVDCPHSCTTLSGLTVHGSVSCCSQCFPFPGITSQNNSRL